ncbi:MAG: M20 family metallopeptidase [Deltaproteobacteria bacterium]|nr:M20 family metallopeptidase [Deltaproteobacteria bacterium]
MNASLNALSLTRKLLGFNTMNPPNQERDCAVYLGKLLEDGGFDTQFYEFEKGRTSLVARTKGPSDLEPICFTGHMDTIPLGAARWTRDPFKGETDGDWIYGRGVADMKGGVAAMVMAGLHMARLPKGKAGVILVITAGEETGCEGAYFLASHETALGKAGALVVGEPTSNFPIVGHKGALWIEARASGVAAHGSMPEKGVNAIYKAAHAVKKLEDFNFDVAPHKLLGSPTLNVGTIRGGININSVPDQALIGIDIRTIPDQGNKEVYERLSSYLGDELTLHRVIDVEGIATDPQDEWVQGVFEIMKPILKERPVARGVTYFTDASVLTPALGNPPTVILGPGEPEMAHKTDERCRISKIEEAAEAYLKIAERWCGI